MVCVPSVVTTASATPAATACCAPNATFCDLVKDFLTFSPALVKLLPPDRYDLASLPSLDNLLTADAAPKPGTANCVIPEAIVPTAPSGSIPKSLLVLSAHKLNCLAFCVSAT
jgi:hypothetical protein